MIPNNITSANVIKALEQIEREGIPNNRQSTKHDLIYKGKRFPPKFVISKANFYANQEELDPSVFSGGDETNSYLSELGFEIVPKQKDIPYYLKADDAEMEWKNNEVANELTYFPTTDDNRQIAMRQLKIRRGQHAFRQALRKRYGDQCMITKCQLLDIIEAAHLSPYRGDADNNPENGLLLRADLHTLFDLDLLGIHPESLQVQFHPKVLAAGYHDWKDNKLCCSTLKPSEAALKSRWKLFLRRLQSEK